MSQNVLKSMKPHSSRVKKWKAWLEKIAMEVGRLRTFIEIRRHFSLVVQQSPVKEIKDAFWTYIGFAMLDELVIRAVRICDPQAKPRSERRVYSLRALLEECLEHAEFFTRRRFVERTHPPRVDPLSHYTEGTQPLPPIEIFRMRNYDFDTHVGTGRNQLTKQEIQKDIDELDAAIKELKKFRNKFIAHNDFRKATRKAPKYEEIPKSVEVISKLTKKYYLLITRSGLALESYVFHTDITRLFDRSWVETEQDKSLLKDKFKNGNRAT